VPFICKRTAIVVANAQTSLISRYSSSRIHLRVRKPRSLGGTNELGAVAPDAIHRIGKRYLGRIARVPASSARRAFCAALSSVKGGRGGRVTVDPYLSRLPCAGRNSWASDQLRYLATFENDFQLENRSAERRLDAIYQATRALVFSEDISSATRKRRQLLSADHEFPEVATDTPSLTSRVTLSSDPNAAPTART